MRLIFDAGALIALERNEPAMWERLKLAIARNDPPLTHAGVVGQVWRGRGSRQARLAAALDYLDIRPLDEAMGRAAGELLSRVKHDDVIDAALVLLAHDGDRIVTADPDDIAVLARASHRNIEVIGS